MARVAVAGLVGGALALSGGAATALAYSGGVSPALAQEPVRGEVQAGKNAVWLKLEGVYQEVPAFSIKIDGKKVPSYCVQLHTDFVPRHKYREASWDEAKIKDLPLIQWVLLHGIPNVGTGDLAKAAGTEVLADPKRADQLARAATQAAVWHFSDGITLEDRTEPAKTGVPNAEEYAFVVAIYKYLVSKATAEPEPAPALSITPAKASAQVGEKAGPFTVTTNGGEITLKVTGGEAVDADGAPLKTIGDGEEFWLTSDEAGVVKVTASGSGKVPFGRVFQHADEALKDKSQKMVLAGRAGAELTAEAGAEFTVTPASPSPSPTPVPGEGGGLPITGAPLASAIVGGLALLAAGSVTLLLMRRRRIRFTA